jgi:hypothetical protein
VHNQGVRRAARYIYLSDADPIAAVRDREDATGARIAWRIVAANNRPLGRSEGTYPTLAECVASAGLLHEEIARVETAVGFDASKGQWRWGLTLDGIRVAACVHAYGRRIECHRGLSQFLEAASTALPAPEEVRHLGVRAMRDYDTTGPLSAERGFAVLPAVVD